MKFIDLFAGLGGFHLALGRLGHQCVFASELDEILRKTYEENFGIKPMGDIKKVEISSIPKHDILCAGFPCQPFSKAGVQKGLKCPRWGDLFKYVIRILRYHKPRYFILENVPNLARHRNGDTWKYMRSRLKGCGYDVKQERFSPHQFGIPQIRDRVYIVGRLETLKSFLWPSTNGHTDISIISALEDNPTDAKRLSPQVIKCLNAWQTFISSMPDDDSLPSFPIWSMEFGATYPYEKTTPYKVGARNLSKYFGAHGKPLVDLPAQKRLSSLPSYARTEEDQFPDWKIDFIAKNREFYDKHKSVIDLWRPSILQFPPSLQKLEWNCKGEERDIWKYVIQFRASGVRVKRPNTSPSLVSMTTTQVPIIAWQKRYLTPRECAKLQSLGELAHLPPSDTAAFKALGNAINADVVERIAKSLLPANAGKRGENVLKPNGKRKAK